MTDVPVAAASAAAVTDPTLEEARAAFARGDFARTRVLADEILARSGATEEIRRAAETLRTALGTDPLALALGVACLIFLALTAWFTLR